jgi:PAS domain S-box-containing protein
MGTRRAIQLLCIGLLAIHVYALLLLPDRRAAAAISNVVQFLLALIVVAASVWAARRSKGALRWWWWCSALAALPWSLGQGRFIYESLLRRDVPAAIPFGPMTFLMVTPLWLGLFLLRMRTLQNDRPSSFFDFAQVIVVAVAAYLQVFYVPTHWPVNETTLLAYIYDFRDIALVAAIWLVYVDETDEEIRRVLRFFGVAFSIYTIGQIYYFHFTTRGQSGGLLDLTMSIPLALIAYVASTCPPLQKVSLEADEGRFAGFYSRVVPLILPVLAALLALRLHEHLPLSADLVLGVTMALYAGRVITEGQIRRRAVADLQVEQLKFYAVTYAANAAILIHDQGRILYANPFVERLSGYSRDELLRMHVADFVLESEREMLRERIKHRYEGEQVPTQFELQVVQRNGEVRCLEFSTTTVQVSSGNAVLAVGFDVTDRKNSEHELADTVSLLEATLESTADGILVVDRQQRIVRHNARFAAMWNLPEDLSDEREDRKLLDGVLNLLRDPDNFLKRVDELYAQPSAETFDMVELKDGRTFERLSRPQVLDGEIIGRVWSFRDITQARRLEEHLRQSQKMEAVGTLAGGIAHDFNNLLTVIIGYGALAQTRAPGNETLQADLSKIVHSAEQAATLTRQLLTFSRKQLVNPTVFDVNQSVRRTLDLLQRIIGEDIRLEANLDPDLGGVEADQSQIDQLLLNLAVNARDAMPRGGVLTFTTRPAPTDGPCIEITVSDTGEGIPNEVLPHIFEPFFTTKEMGRGTGLGLATAYATVQQSRGSIRVETEKGKGTTFIVRLPQVKEAPRKQPSVTAESPRGSATILVVEDESAVRELCSSVLSSRGYRVLQSADAKKALALAEEYPGRFDLLVTDVIMPEISGEELVERLRAQMPGLKVLFISGYDKAPTSSARSVGPLLMKPFTPSELLKKVEQVIADQR